VASQNRFMYILASIQILVLGIIVFAYGLTITGHVLDECTRPRCLGFVWGVISVSEGGRYNRAMHQ
jgi:hypothetical protein